MDPQQVIVNQLCVTNQELQKLRTIIEGQERRDTRIVSIAIPELPTVASQTRSFASGITKIDFKSGIIEDPDGTKHDITKTLDRSEVKTLRSISLLPSQDVILHIVDRNWKWSCTADYMTNVTYLEFTRIEINCSQTTNIKLFVCTNPEAVVNIFSKTVVSTTEQSSVTVDSTEAQTWDTLVGGTLLTNLNRIRNQITTITGEAWGTVSNSIATIWAKFHATTGHTHDATGTNGPKITWGNINKTTSNIADITTKSHTALSDIGTNTHAQIDTSIGTTLPGLVTTHAALTTGTHGVGASTIESTSGSQGKVDTHNTVTNPHSSTAAATADRLMLRDGAGRCAVVAPSASTDIALKSTVTDDIATHAAVTATHGATGAVVGTTNAQTLTVKKYQLSGVLGSDHTAEGIISNGPVGENVVFGDLVYLKSDSKAWKADADSTTTMPGMGLVLATIAADASGEVLSYGYARDDSWAWTVGGLLYASGTAGGMTQTKPTTGIVQVVGQAVASTVIMFNPEGYQDQYNVIAGVTPVASTWSVAPTSLANCTDGSVSTVTGTGTKTLTGSADYGILVFDMGASFSGAVLVAAKLGLWSTDNEVRVKLEESDDNITYVSDSMNVAQITNATEEVIGTTAKLVTRRYFRLRFNLSASDGSTGCSAKIYEVIAIRVNR